MAGSLIELARNGQATVIASLIIAGASGPVTLAGVLAMQNAEILTGHCSGSVSTPGSSGHLRFDLFRHGYENRIAVHRCSRAVKKH